MIVFKWRSKATGEPVTKIQVTHVLTRGDLALLLLRAKLPDTMADLTDMSKAAIEREIREQLRVNADARHWVGDDYAECDHELTFDKVLTWAKRQVATL